MNDERDEIDPAFDAEDAKVDPEIDEEIRRLVAEEEEPRDSEHLDPVQLAAYRDGLLPEDQAATVRAHLLACRECGDLLLDLETWTRGDLGSELPTPSEFEIAAAWKGVREADRGGAAPARSRFDRAAAAIPANENAPAWRSRRAAMALAAAGLIAAVGLSIQNASLRRDLNTLSAPTINAPVADLSATPERGETVEPVAVSLPPGATVFTVVLAPPGAAAFGPVAVEIAAEGENPASSGRLLWQGDGLKPNVGDSYTLTIPLRALDGERRIALRLLDPAGRHPIAVYHLKIAIP